MRLSRTMSEAAIRKRRSSATGPCRAAGTMRLVRWPSLACRARVGLIAVLAIAPFDKDGDVSFILDKNRSTTRRERMRVEKARYVGEDDKGQKFEVVADRAVQQSPTCRSSTITAWRRASGLRGAGDDCRSHRPLRPRHAAIAVDGPVRVVGPDGYRLETRDVTVDLTRARCAAGPAAGAMTLGEFQAGSLSADLGERTVMLDGGVRLKIVQGAVR